MAHRPRPGARPCPGRLLSSTRRPELRGRWPVLPSANSLAMSATSLLLLDPGCPASGRAAEEAVELAVVQALDRRCSSRRRGGRSPRCRTPRGPRRRDDLPRRPRRGILDCRTRPGRPDRPPASRFVLEGFVAVALSRASLRVSPSGVGVVQGHPSAWRTGWALVQSDPDQFLLVEPLKGSPHPGGLGPRTSWAGLGGSASPPGRGSNCMPRPWGQPRPPPGRPAREMTRRCLRCVRRTPTRLVLPPWMSRPPSPSSPIC